ncbi:TIGR02391 family protein [Inquilinus limosus]|uniref:TIGR02391 family protein n=1 Tax=Inquilinus limosus TaxID=171674 RepID=UPI003F18F89C
MGSRTDIEAMHARLNRALAFVGLAFDAGGILGSVDAVSTISEAERRADELRDDLSRRGVHPEVLQFCRTELVADNYFHAVLEAMKSVSDKIRRRTGLTDDGSALVDRALSGDPPMLAINPLLTESHRSEQKGFANLVRGAFGMFRNVTAHEARILWAMNRKDAEDLLSLASLIHRRLDAAHMPPRS